VAPSPFSFKSSIGEPAKLEHSHKELSVVSQTTQVNACPSDISVGCCYKDMLLPVFIQLKPADLIPPTLELEKVVHEA
jgi:hypothetical protein